MPVNVSKSTSTISTLSKGGSVLWADTLATWADASYLWDATERLPADLSKNTSTITMITKS